MKPFHLSLSVSDLDKTKKFYLDILKCNPGRDHGSWIDIVFFGHQITFHQSNQHRPAQSIDHFGPILDKAIWLKTSEALSRSQIQFAMPPKVTNAGLPDESGKFLVRDPAGNLLEFKYYLDFDRTVAEKDRLGEELT
ncbi:MAG: hypothetical protein KTR18_11670 [Acidiferrobacterales bacterium]|nr:hypothetical protein [Acidiferrobacterales bacterium]